MATRQDPGGQAGNQQQEPQTNVGGQDPVTQVERPTPPRPNILVRGWRTAEGIGDWIARKWYQTLNAVERAFAYMGRILMSVTMFLWATLDKIVNFLRIPELIDLKVYGDRNLEPPASKAILDAKALIGVNFVIDVFAWMGYWFIGLQTNAWVYVLGMAFPLLIALVDLSLYKVDVLAFKRAREQWSKWMGWMKNPFLLRIILALGFTFATALPLDLLFMRQEIVRQLDRDKKPKLDKIREDAVASKRDEYEKLIAEASKGSSDGQSAALEGRKGARSELIASLAEDRKPIEARIKELDRRIADEIAGNGTSKKGTCGRICQDLKQTKAETVAERTEAEKTAREAIVAFDKETDSMRRGDTDTGSSKVRALQRERQEEENKIRRLDPKELAAIYSGDFEESNGISDQHRALWKVIRSDWSNFFIVMLVHLVMMAPSLLLILFKGRAPKELHLYYSREYQAAKGNPDVLEGFRVEGYEPSIDGFFTDEKVQQVHKEIHDADEALVTAFRSFETTIRQEASPQRTKSSEIEKVVHKHWDKIVVPALDRVRRAERAAAKGDIRFPKSRTTWGSAYPGEPHPRRFIDNMFDSLLEIGWVDAGPLLRRAAQLQEKVRAEYARISMEIGHIEDEARSRAVGNPTMPYATLQQQKYAAALDRVFRPLRELGPILDEIQSLGEEIPPLPSRMPSLKGPQAFFQVNTDELRVLGWTGPVPEVVVPVVQPKSNGVVPPAAPAPSGATPVATPIAPATGTGTGKVS
ncbi:DUF4407 domain-containing protein [Candidatus Uhrbacteria bacterium]|nr:DUF4407 domain-containing protein [Candidatus Uhrbacteria bacterium]